MSNNYYSKIPNKLFYSNIENERSIFKLVYNDVKVLFILDYLYISTNRKNLIKFTLEDMILSCGFTPDKHRNRSNDKFKNILSILCSNNYIDSCYNFEKVKPNELLSCTLCIDLTNKYTQLYDQEKQVVFGVSNKDEKIDKFKLLMYFCYLKSRMYRRKKDDDIAISGGRAETTWVSFELIHKDINLTDETIKKYNDLLVKLNLIRIANAGLWHYSDDKNKVVRESPNFYALFNGDETKAKKNLTEAIKYYKSQDKNKNKVFIDSRTYKNNNRSFNGKLGAIIKKQNNGNATEQDILIKNQILESKNADSEEYKFKALLEANPNETISQIYSAYNEGLADKYYDLELELGLTNSNGHLLVDRKYYTWAITNYKKYDRQYMINCIAKHRREQISITVDYETGEVLVAQQLNDNCTTTSDVAIDDHIETRLPFNGFYAEIANKKSSVPESEPNTSDNTPEDRDYKLPWEEDGDSEIIDINSISDSMFETEIAAPYSPTMTPDKKQKNNEESA